MYYIIDEISFFSGDGRVNQQVMLVTLHTLFMREHNRIATELSHINKHWDDERIFQVRIEPIHINLLNQNPLSRVPKTAAIFLIRTNEEER